MDRLKSSLDKGEEKISELDGIYVKITPMQHRVGEREGGKVEGEEMNHDSDLEEIPTYV